MKRIKQYICLLLAAALCLTACSSTTGSEGTTAAATQEATTAETTAADTGDGLFTAGTYTGTGDGNNGPITVEVVFDANSIVSVTVTEHGETAGIADPALERIPAEIVEYQSLAVDTVASATMTSNGILAAVEDCVTQAGGDVEALKTPIETEEAAKTEETQTADVVVVGSGISGLTAAIAAAEAGSDVVVIEKAATTGGTTALAGGYLICVESELYADSGFDDSLDTFREYWDERMSYSGQDSGYPDMERWEYVVSQTGDTVDWMSDLGVTWQEEIFTGFGAYPVAYNPGGGRGLIDELVTIAEGQGVEILLECTGEELVVDADGAVTGIVAETADSIITFEAPAVILATGGISQNAELVEQYSPKVAQAGTISVAAASSTGDGLLMAIDAGAAVFDEFFTSIYATTVDPEFQAAVADAATLTTTNQLGINANGERFASEVPVYVDALGSDMIQDGNAPFWYIYDSSNADVTAILEQGVEAGVVAKGETIEELAGEMGVDAATLQATYDRYEELAAAGEDEDFNKPAENLVALETAPYYAVKFYPTTFGSQGGVLTDSEGRVLNDAGEVISGLYAAGEMSNRYYYNENYVLAASLGLYAVAGRLAGAAAAADIQ